MDGVWEVTALAGKFEVYEDESGKFRFRLRASNGQVVASGQGYASKASAKRGCESVLRAAQDEELVEAESVSVSWKTASGTVTLTSPLGGGGTAHVEAVPLIATWAKLFEECREQEDSDERARRERLERFIGSVSAGSNFTEDAGCTSKDLGRD